MSSPTSEHIEPAPGVVVRAGAGAGKTTELIQRVVDFIRASQEQGRDPRLCLTTFTRKATQEIRERLLSKALALGDPRFLRYVQSSQKLQISTIHGTLKRYLSQFGAALGLAPEFTLINGWEERRLIKKNLRRILETDGEDLARVLTSLPLASYIDAFIEWRVHQIRFPESRGLGRDDVLFEHQQQLAKIQNQARSLCDGLAFVKLTKSWQALREWLGSPLAATVEQGLQTWLEASQDRPRVGKSKEIPESMIELKDELYKALDEIEDWSFTSEFADRLQEVKDSFENSCHELEARVWKDKLRRGQLTLSDLEVVALKLMKAHPQTADQFSRQWDYWLIDEYQDTSPLQVELLRGLIGRGREFIVGDPQQSIYLFRGARSEVFLEKETLARNGKGELKVLARNYRSTPRLMNFLNSFLTSVSSQLSPMEIGRTDDGNWSQPVALFWNLSETDADAAVVERLQELIAHGAAPESICILARRHSDLERIAKVAADHGLPTYLHTTSKFAVRREVRDALALLKFLVNPHDNINLIELVRSPWFAIKDATLAELSVAGPPNQSYWARLSVEQSTKIRLQQALGRCETEGIGRVWEDELITSGLLPSSSMLDPSGRREGNLWKLVTALRWAERQGGFSYAQFAADIENGGGQDEDRSETEAPPVIEPQKVNFMTIHASKGLQFDHIILPDAGADPQIKIRHRVFVSDEGTWCLSLKDTQGQWTTTPWAKRQLQAYKERELAENDRLLYVAATRARLSLSLLWGEIKKNSWAERFHTQLCKSAPKPPEAAKVAPQTSTDTEFRNRAPAPSPLSALPKRNEGLLVRAPWKSGLIKPAPIEIARNPLDWDALEKIQAGIEVHRWMEALKVNWLHSEAEWLRQRLSQECVDIEYLMKNGFVEWSFILKNGSSEAPTSVGGIGGDSVAGAFAAATCNIKRGRIDLWGRDSKNQVWIIDYKTGSVQYKDKAFEQLRQYADALHVVKAVDKNEKIYLLPIFIHDQPVDPITV